jgi:flagellar hook-length control protein FliK
MIPPTLPASPVIANPTTAATKPEVSHAAVAVPPAPTFGVPEATQRELPAASVVPGHAPAQGTEPAERSAPFAVSAAKSAEAGKAGAVNPNQVDVGEIRPVFERVSDAAGNVPIQGAQPQASTQSFAIETPQLRMTTPFAQAGWVQEVDQNLHWMVGNTRQQADLVLNPPELGRIEVTLVIQGDEVSASFASPHQAVREAIEESLVRLRESLSDSGINLGQTHVGRDSSRDAPFMKAEGDGQQGRGARQEGTMPIGTPLTQGSAFQSRGRGMVDVFA